MLAKRFAPVKNRNGGVWVQKPSENFLKQISRIVPKTDKIRTSASSPVNRILL